MALDELEARLAYLLTSLEDNPEDAHEVLMLVRQKLSQIKALNLPLPADLVEMEQKLAAELDGPSA